MAEIRTPDVDDLLTVLAAIDDPEIGRAHV